MEWVVIGGLALLLWMKRQPPSQVIGGELAGLTVPTGSDLYGGGTADDTGAGPSPDYLDPTSGGLILGPPSTSIIGAGPLPGNLQPGESAVIRGTTTSRGVCQ